MGRYITTTGTANNVIREVSGAFNATVNDRILANSTAAAFTITLPNASTLLLNDTIQIIDIGGLAATNNITIGRNGAKIQNITDDLTIDVNGSIITLIYSGATYGWVVASA
jgi:hypothetical protein